MKANQSGRLSPVAAMLLFGFFSSTAVQADVTGWLSPESGDGTYTQWSGSSGGTGGATVNDGIGCAAGLDTFWTAGLNTYRASAVIAIPGTVPDGATIHSVDIQVCQSRGIAGTPPAGATFQTFVRIDSTNTDSGTNIAASTPVANVTEHTQNIALGVVRTPTTVLQAGTVKTNAIGSQRIYTLAARINYTIPGSTTTVSCISPTAIGNTSTCTATIAPSAGGTTPTGAVTWGSSDAGSFSGESCTPGAGTLSCTATFTPAGVGTPTVTATFAGDANMTGSNGTDGVQVVVPASTTTVTCASPIQIDGSSVCTATVAPGLGSVTPTGAVTWGTSVAGSFSAESCTPGVGSLTCSATFTPGGVGTTIITATFAGDANMTGSNGTDDVEIIVPGSTTTVSCVSPIEIDGTSACTATVAPSAGSAIPTGALTWSTSDAGTFSGESCTPGIGSLTCSATFTPAEVGIPTVTATFAGDGNMTGSSGADDVQVDEPAVQVAVPVFGPLGFLLTLLGVTAIGGWYSRRRY